MEKDNKYYDIIVKIVKKHRKFAGLEAILDDIVDDIYNHSEVIINSVQNEGVICAYFEKVAATSIITVPKRLNFHPELKHATISNVMSDVPKVNNTLVDNMINGREQKIMSAEEFMAEDNNEQKIFETNDEINNISIPVVAESSVDEQKNMEEENLLISNDSISLEPDVETEQVLGNEFLADDEEDCKENFSFDFVEEVDDNNVDDIQNLLTQEDGIIDEQVTEAEFDNENNITIGDNENCEENDSFELVDNQSSDEYAIPEIVENADDINNDEFHNLHEEVSENLSYGSQDDMSEEQIDTVELFKEPEVETEDVLPVDNTELNLENNAELNSDDFLNTSDEGLDITEQLDEEQDSDVQSDFVESLNFENKEDKEDKVIDMPSENTVLDLELQSDNDDNLSDTFVEKEENTLELNVEDISSDNNQTIDYTEENFEEMPLDVVEELPLDTSTSEDLLASGNDETLEEFNAPLNDEELNFLPVENLELDSNDNEVLLDENSENSELVVDLSDDLGQNDNISNSLLEDNNPIIEENESNIKTDFSKFNFNPDAISIDGDIDENVIVKEIQELALNRPELNIVKIYNLRYKDNRPVSVIASELGMSEEQVIDALNEIIAII